MKKMLFVSTVMMMTVGLLMLSNVAQAKTNLYGGPVYEGAPALTVTAALVKAGGGAKDFSFPKALVSMLGEKTVNAEVAKLTKQYGEEAVNKFLAGMTWDIRQGLELATEAGIKLPKAPKELHGAALAKALVSAGTASDGTWWTGLLFDHAISNKLHMQVMKDADKHFGPGYDGNTHKILNQAMYDVAHALGETQVKLAPLH